MDRDPVYLLVSYLVFTILIIIFSWVISKKAGFPSTLALWCILPFGSLIVLLVLAFSSWPALSQDRKGHQP